MKRKRILPKGWKAIEIGKEFQTGSGGTPLSTKSEYYEDGTIPWINSGELEQSSIDSTNNYITELGLQKSSAKMFPAGTVLVAMYGATAGKASILNIDACTNQAICAILENPEYSSLFLKYNIDNLYDYLVRSSSGSARDNLSQDGIASMILFFPQNKKEQVKIVNILAALDKKIKLNTCMIAELEATTKQLYDYWFVQFDFPDENGKPYKSSGGKMVYNEKLKREIPEGWEVCNTGNYSIIARGSVITEKEASPGNVKVVAAGLNCAYYHNVANRTANVISISTSGANAGYVNFWREPIYASDCMTIQCENLIDTLLCLMNLRNYQSSIMNMAHGSAQPHVYPEQIKEIPIINPPKNVKVLLNDLFAKVNQEIAKKTKEIEHLTHLRDSLLPMLMNGQVTVK